MKNRNDETGCDRRGFLKCTAWVGTGAVWTMASGILKGMPIEQAASSGAGTEALRCVQISDSHIGFNKGANPDVTATLRIAIAKIDALPQAPSFVQFSHRFEGPGTYPHYCSLHPKMTGRIVVA